MTQLAMHHRGIRAGKIFFLTSLVLILGIGALPHSTEASPPTNATWNLVPGLSDEFNGTTLDTSKWQKGLWYPASGAGAFNDNNVSVSGGNLVLTAKKESYNGYSYTFGSVESKFDVPCVNSYVEIRAKALPSAANVLSAIWMESSPFTSASNPNPEIDIQETSNFNAMVSNLHTWQVSPDVHTGYGSNTYNTGVDVSQAFHVYGLERREGKLRFYFDGALAWEMTPGDPALVDMARHMVFSLEGHLGNPVDDQLPGQYLVDYVRTYYSTVSGSPANGTYKIVNRLSGKALNMPGESTADGTQLIQWPYGGQNNEKWVLSKNEDGTYWIKNVNSSKFIDLNGFNTANGTAIIQWGASGASNQKWHIVPLGNGYFKILSNVSGKAMVVQNASTADGAPIIEWSFGTTMNDQWQIVAP